MSVIKRFLKKQRTNEDGSVLLTVIAIMSFAAILTATAFSFVQTASKRSFDNVDEKQSYYTASTCLETFVESVLTPESPNWDAFTQIAATGGTSQPIEIPGMGTCTISVQSVGSGLIQVVATAEVSGKEESVACYLRAVTEPGEADFKNAIELTGASGVGYNNINILGDFAGSDGDDTKVYTFTNQPTIYGKYFQYGTIWTNNHISFYESLTGEGSSLTASKYVYFTSNDITVNPNVKKQNNNASNYVCAGSTFVTGNTHNYLGLSQNDKGNMENGNTPDIDGATGIRPNDVDVFAYGIVLGLDDTAAAGTDFSKAVYNDLNTIRNSDGNQLQLGLAGNSYSQYGNIYCYAKDEAVNTEGKTDGLLAGNMVLEKSSGYTATIYGDVYVEGNLYVETGAVLNIYGNLYVGGDIIGTGGSEGKVTVKADAKRELIRPGSTGNIYCTKYNATTNKTDDNVFDLEENTFTNVKAMGGRGEFPSTEYEGMQYLYYAEDILVSEEDKGISTISDEFKFLVSNKESYYPSALNFEKNKDYEDDEGLKVKFDMIITESCYLTNEELQNVRNVLVEVSASHDVIVVFANGTNLADKQFFVKNESKPKDDTGEADESLKPRFCYFTVDTYKEGASVEIQYKKDESGNLILDEKGEKQIIGSTHTGFVTDAKLSMNNTRIVDYDTWKNSLNCINVNGVSGGNLPLNLTGIEKVGTYSPNEGYIVFLLTEGTTVDASGNQCLIEAAVFGRQASISFNQGLEISYDIGVSSLEMIIDKKNTFSIGSMIVGKLTTSNTTWAAFCPPSKSSDLANVGGSGGAEKIRSFAIYKYSSNLSIGDS